MKFTTTMDIFGGSTGGGTSATDEAVAGGALTVGGPTVSEDCTTTYEVSDAKWIEGVDFSESGRPFKIARTSFGTPNDAIICDSNADTTVRNLTATTVNGQTIVANTTRSVDQDLNTTDAVTFASVNGRTIDANTTRSVDQDTNTTDAVTFATVNLRTIDANTTRSVDQDTNTTDAVTFASVNGRTIDANTTRSVNQDTNTTDAVTFASVNGRTIDANTTRSVNQDTNTTDAVTFASVNGRTIDANTTRSVDQDTSTTDNVTFAQVTTTGNILPGGTVDGVDIAARDALSVINNGSSTDNAVPKFDSTTGTTIQTSGVTIDDSNNVVTTGGITFPQPVGEMFTDNNTSTTTITTQSTFVKATVDTSDGRLVSYTNSGSNRLTYTGTMTKFSHIGATFSLNVGTNPARAIDIRIYKNGTAIPGSSIVIETTGNSNNSSSAIHCMTSMSTNDYLELWVSNEGGTEDINVTRLNLFSVHMAADAGITVQAPATIGLTGGQWGTSLITDAWSVAGASGGSTYSWSVTSVGTGTATITTPSAATTTITFNHDDVYDVKCDVNGGAQTDTYSSVTTVWDTDSGNTETWTISTGNTNNSTINLSNGNLTATRNGTSAIGGIRGTVNVADTTGFYLARVTWDVTGASIGFTQSTYDFTASFAQNPGSIRYIPSTNGPTSDQRGIQIGNTGDTGTSGSASALDLTAAGQTIACMWIGDSTNNTADVRFYINNVREDFNGGDVLTGLSGTTWNLSVIDYSSNAPTANGAYTIDQAPP